MARIVTPTQLRYNDPYSQRMFQYDIPDTKLYLSRISNLLLKSIGDNAIIRGFDITSTTIDSNIVSITLSPGLLIQDSTLIEVTEPVTLDIDVTTYDPCDGKLIIYTNYQYLDTINATQLRFKLSYVTNYGDIYPSSDPWDENRNKIYLELFDFTKDPVTLTNITNPNYFYIAGAKYVRRGTLNFVPEESGAPTPADYFTIFHDQETFNIVSQLYNNEDQLVKFDDFQIIDNSSFKFSIDSYRPFSDYYHFNLANSQDIESFTIDTSLIDQNYQYTLEHNLNTQDLIAFVYDNNLTLVQPRLVRFIDLNHVFFDFSNLYRALAGQYKVYIIKDHITKYQIEITEDTIFPITIQHELGKRHINIQVQDSLNRIVNISTPVLDVSDKNILYITPDSCSLSTPDFYNILLYDNIIVDYNIDTNGNISFPCQYFIRDFTGDDLVDDVVTIYHNMNTLYPLVYVYNSDRELVTPDLIHILDNNSVEINVSSFNITTETYTAVIYFSEQQIIAANTINLNLDGGSATPPLSGYDSEVDCGYSTASPPSGSEISYDGGGAVRFDTNIFDFTISDRIQSPVFQFYTQEYEQFTPDIFRRYDATNYHIDTTSFIGLTSFYIVYTEGYSIYSEALADENLTYGKIQITHNLNTNYPIVQLWDNNNYLIKPDNIKILSLNTIELDLSSLQPLPGQHIVEIIGGNICSTNQTVTYTNILGILDTDPTLSRNSNLHIPSQRAIKTYIDTIYDQLVNVSTPYSYNGKHIVSVVGEDVLFGDILYLNTDSKWYRLSNIIESEIISMLSVALENKEADDNCYLGLPYLYINNPLYSLIPGKPVYASINGALSITEPASGYRRILGHALSTNILFFNPDNIVYEVL